jgi:hypothetical protein
MQRVDGLWVAAAGSDADRELANGPDGGRIDMEDFGADYRVRLLDIDAERYDLYYNRISNGILWFVHHYLWDTVRQPVFDDEVDLAWNEYVAVNRRFAEALAEEADRSQTPPAFLVQDYHLTLVPRSCVTTGRVLAPSHTAIAGLTYLGRRPHPGGHPSRDARGRRPGFHSQVWARTSDVSRSSRGCASTWHARACPSGTPGRRADARYRSTRWVCPGAAGRGHALRRLNRWRGDSRLVLPSTS